MSAISLPQIWRPQLWTPGHRSALDKYRRWWDWIHPSHLKKSGTTGHLLKKANGHLVKTCPSGDPGDPGDGAVCAGACGSGSGQTPNQFSVTFNSLNYYAGCCLTSTFSTSSCDDPPDPGLCIGQTITGTLGTYSVPQTAGDSCVWYLQTSGVTIKLFSGWPLGTAIGNVCGNTYLTGTYDRLYVVIAAQQSGGTRWIDVDAGVGSENWPTYPDFGGIPLPLFSGSYTLSGLTKCSDLSGASVTNDLTMDCTVYPANSQLAGDGTASLTAA